MPARRSRLVRKPVWLNLRMDVVLNALLAVAGLSFLVIIHESGHYFVARAFGMRVLRYSIGLGPALFRYKPKDSPTTFQVCAIPLLAYVQVEGMNPFEDIDWDDPDIFPNKSLFGRVATIAAGPAANYLAAVLLTFGVALYGWPGAERTPMQIGEVIDHSPARAAGFQTGDVVLSVDGEPVRDFFDLRDLTEPRHGQPSTYRIRRDGEELDLEVTPAHLVTLPIGVRVAGYGEHVPSVLVVGRNSPASKLREGDVIRRIGDREVHSGEELYEALAGAESLAVTFHLVRGDKEVSVTIPPTVEAEKLDPERISVVGQIGVKWFQGPMTVSEAATFAVWFPIRFSWENLKGLGGMFTDFDPDKVIGPGGMLEIISDGADQGFFPYVHRLIFLSVALGFFNLLPFPALDGGRLVFLGYEMITRQRPNARFEAMVHTVGILLLLSVLMLVTFRDIFRQFFLG